MPTFIHGKASKFAVAEAASPLELVDLSAYTKEASFPRSMDMAETSAFGNIYKTYIQGLTDATISIAGQWDATATVGPDVVLGNLIGAAAPVGFVYGPNGWVSLTPSDGSGTSTVTGSAAKPVWTGTVWLSSYEITSSIGDVVAFSAEFQLAIDPTRRTGGYTFA